MNNNNFSGFGNLDYATQTKGNHMKGTGDYTKANKPLSLTQKENFPSRANQMKYGNTKCEYSL